MRKGAQRRALSPSSNGNDGLDQKPLVAPLSPFSFSGAPIWVKIQIVELVDRLLDEHLYAEIADKLNARDLPYRWLRVAWQLTRWAQHGIVRPHAYNGHAWVHADRP